MRILVICAHPDDEILGIGGTLLKHKSNGDEIFICVLTDAWEPVWTRSYAEEKKKIQDKIDMILGTTKRFHLHKKSTELNIEAHGLLNDDVNIILKEVNPDIVYTHFYGDSHFDHRITYETTMVITRPPRTCKVICYETPSETEWGPVPFKPNLWVDVSEFIEKKLEIISLYHTELKEYPHPRSPENIRLLSQKRGSEICKKNAEAFIIMREYQ